MAYLGKTPSQAVRSRYYFTASGGETSLSGTDDNSNTLTFTDGNYVDVSLNGVALVAGSDYNTTTANTIGGLSALTASDVVEVVVYDTFSVFGGKVLGDFDISNGTLSAEAVTVTSLTTTGNINFGDNDKAVFGAGSDIEILSNGTAGLIKNGNATSDIRIESDNRVVVCDRGFDETFAVFNDDGDVKLYHNNSEKLATTSSGIDVTGTVDVSGSAGATLKLTSTDTTGADTELLGQIDFVSSDSSTGSAGTQARIKGVYEDNGDSSGIAFLTGASTGSGTPTIAEVMRIRHEGLVGIGTDSPSEELTVSKSDDARISITSSGTGKAAMTGLLEFDGNDGRHGYIGPVGGVMRLNTDGGYDIMFQPGGTEKVRIKSTGNVGIGKSAPASALHISNSTYPQLEIDDAASRNYAMGVTSSTFRIRDVTGTADRLIIDSSGNVGIGVVPTGSWNLQLASSSGSSRIRMQNSTTGTADGDGGSVAMENNDFVINNGETGVMKFETGGSETARFDSSGRLYMGTSTFAFPFGEAFLVDGNDGHRVLCSRGSTATREQIIFYNPNGDVGSIDTSGSSTSYNTSSDHRLKENVADMTGAIARVKQLAPKRFNFIADPDDTMVDGFLAHEAQTVVPEAVTGTHNEVDDDGNAVMQGIDQSKLVPLLTGALKEAITKIEALETSNANLIARIETLENA